MEEEGQPGDMMIQSRLSNSTESIDSMKALTAAIDAANAQVSAWGLVQCNDILFARACAQNVGMTLSKYACMLVIFLSQKVNVLNSEGRSDRPY